MTRAQVGNALLSLMLVGCGTSPSPSATEPATATPSLTVAAPTTFVSTFYHYTMTLPAGWSTAHTATVAWTGAAAVSHDGPDVDLFGGESLAWGYALRTSKTLAAFIPQFNRDVAAAHPCPAKPESDRVTTLGGSPARFLSMHCPAAGGILVLTVLAAKGGIMYVFQFQDPFHAATDDADRATFSTLLGSVRLP